jgi:hypothetical protein
MKRVSKDITRPHECRIGSFGQWYRMDDWVADAETLDMDSAPGVEASEGIIRSGGRVL